MLFASVRLMRLSLYLKQIFDLNQVKKCVHKKLLSFFSQIAKLLSFADVSNKKLRFSHLFMLIAATALFTGCASDKELTRDVEQLAQRARAHTDLGAAYFQQDKLEVALNEFTVAKEIDPTFALAYNGLGLVHAALGQDDLADGYFKKSIQLEPTNSESHNNYGSFLCGRNRIDESITQFMAAVKNPLYGTPQIAYTNAGICATRKGDTVSATRYFQNALQFDPLFNVAAYQLALLQFKQNKPVEAKVSLQNVLLSNPTPDMLWLAVQIEREVGARDAEASYALQLRKLYPNSEQAKLLQSGN